MRMSARFTTASSSHRDPSSAQRVRARYAGRCARRPPRVPTNPSSVSGSASRSQLHFGKRAVGIELTTLAVHDPDQREVSFWERTGTTPSAFRLIQRERFDAAARFNLNIHSGSLSGMDCTKQTRERRPPPSALPTGWGDYTGASCVPFWMAWEVGASLRPRRLMRKRRAYGTHWCHWCGGLLRLVGLPAQRPMMGAATCGDSPLWVVAGRFPGATGFMGTGAARSGRISSIGMGKTIVEF